MIRVLLVPSSDYLGHPFPQRHNQIFERLNDGNEFEVHVTRFNLFDETRLKSKLIIHELGGRRHGNPASYYLSYAIDHASQIRKIIRQESIDVVVLSNLIGPFAFSLFDKLSSMHIPIVVDLPDYYPTSAAGYVFGAKTCQGRLLTGFLDLMLRQIMKHADLVTVASNALRDYSNRAGAQWVEYVPNGISECFLELYRGNSIREKLGYSNDDFVIGYIGTVEFWLDLQMLFKGIALARKKRLYAKLLVVGKSLHTGFLKRVEYQMNKEGVARSVTWLDFVRHEEVPIYMSGIDVGTIPFDVCNPTAYYSAPNKMWEYLSQLRNVISTHIPEALSNSNYLSIVSTPEDYSWKFLQIRENDRFLAEKTQKGYLESHKRTWSKSVSCFRSLLRKLLRRRSS